MLKNLTDMRTQDKRVRYVDKICRKSAQIVLAKCAPCAHGGVSDTHQAHADKETARSAVMLLPEPLQKDMNQWVEEVKGSSANLKPLPIDKDQEHFDLMISYSVNTEQNFANRLYDKILLTKSPALAKVWFCTVRWRRYCVGV